jgi:Family of unknown function (DUF6090)
MIKFFRKIRQNLLSEGKTGKYFKYAIGEIVLVVIGILIALSINNWNQKQIEKKQIRNIYARIVQDFNHTAIEIEQGVMQMDKLYPLMQNIIEGDVVRDSLLTNRNYFLNYYMSTSGFPDIHINDKGIRLLESKIELDYELNNELTEALTLLYSEYLFEIEVDAEAVKNNFSRMSNYAIEKGVRVDFRVNKNRNSFVKMIFDDGTFKNYFFTYSNSYRRYKNLLIKFKSDGEVLIDKIKTEYNLE